MKLHKYTEIQLREACASSLSIRESLQKLGVIPAGGNYATFKKAVDFFKIDTAHFLGRSANQGNKHRGGVAAASLDSLLVEGGTAQSYKLKLRLLREGILEAKCSACYLSTWNSELSNNLDVSIPLELDHINGIRNDNRLSNLRLLCPNCHALTDTYRAKNSTKPE